VTAHTCDVLVAGAGIIGAVTALELAGRGLTVLCAGQDAATPGTASSAAGAMLGVLGEVTAGQDSALDDAGLRLRDQAARAWPALAGRIHDLTGQPVPIRHGTIVIANLVNQGDRANLAAIRAAARQLSLPCESADPASVPYLAPAPGHQPAEALWLPGEGYIDTSLLLPALRAAVRAHPGIRRLPRQVRQVAHDNHHATGAVLGDGTPVRAGIVVLAAGTGTQALLDQIGARAGVTARLLPGKGTSFTFRDPGHGPDSVIRTPNRDFACGTHLIPRQDGNHYLGATNRIAATPGGSEQPSPGEIHALIHSACHEISTRIRTAAFTGTRYGMRPLSSDGHPLIGPTALAGLHLATGTYRNGILLAPAIASIIAAAVTSPEADPGPFAPAAGWRAHAPAIPALLTAGVPHIVSFLLEPGGRLPYNRQHELETALLALFRLAFTSEPGPALDALRERCITLLASASVPETVPQVFYELTTPR
jgi:glycine/D-amino acid oxidase-like deaminating enzyme